MNRLRNNKRGFTLIELIVVIVVLGILATIVSVNLVRQQASARNAERDADITTLTEALEKYYDTHGEYPSCGVMTQDAAEVSRALNVSQDALKAPRSSDENSVICASLNSGDTDQFGYIGDGSSECQSGGGCLEWTIQYRDDETGEVKEVKSRRTVSLTTSGQVSLTATPVSDGQINLSWNAVPNATSYLVQQSRDINMINSLVTTTTTALSSEQAGLLAGTRYFFRVTPIHTGQSGLLGAADATTTVGAPTGAFTTAASLQSSNTIARGTIGALSCSLGATPAYTIGSQARNTNTAVAVGYPAWGTSTSRDVTASQGYNYTFQAKARCEGPDATSGEVVSSASNITRPINAPPAPVFTGDTSMRAGYRYLLTYNSSCPIGTSLVGPVGIWNSGFSGSYRHPSSGYYLEPNTEYWYLGWAAGQVWEDVYYYAIYQCKTDFDTSPNSAASSTYMTVECEPARRSYSASPRCDSYGQSPSSLPWGP